MARVKVAELCHDLINKVLLGVRLPRQVNDVGARRCRG